MGGRNDPDSRSDEERRKDFTNAMKELSLKKSIKDRDLFRIMRQHLPGFVQKSKNRVSFLLPNKDQRKELELHWGHGRGQYGVVYPKSLSICKKKLRNFGWLLTKDQM